MPTGAAPAMPPNQLFGAPQADPSSVAMDAVSQLKQVLEIATAVAGQIPAVAEKMQAVRQATVEALLVAQQAAQPAGGSPY